VILFSVNSNKSKEIQDAAIVTMEDYRKSHMTYRLVR